MTPIGSAASATCIAVFAKAPVPGEVKTRLVPLLGDIAAAELHALLVRRALATAIKAALGPVELWCAPDRGHPFFEACAAEFGIALRDQRGGDLGERMLATFETLLASASTALLIGSDAPALSSADLIAAAAVLRDGKDAVFQPAEDGGYVLVGLRRPIESLFRGLRWSTDDVWKETRSRLERSAIHWAALETRWDVDRPEDYKRLLASGLLGEQPA
jgi:rSAM/selenodomain-associated transferase 1